MCLNIFDMIKKLLNCIKVNVMLKSILNVHVIKGLLKGLKISLFNGLKK